MTNERLSVPTIRATLEDMRKHGLRGGLPQQEAFFLLAELDHLAVALGAARQLLEDWMLAGSDFDMEAWATRVRDMLEDSNPFNSRAHEPREKPFNFRDARGVLAEPKGDWVKTTEREPTAADARNGRVLVFYPDEKTDVDMEETHWINVTEHPNLYPWWRPMPSPPNREGSR